MEYSIFISTLKQLYMNKKIDLEKIKSYYNKKIITYKEYEFIIGKNR